MAENQNKGGQPGQHGTSTASGQQKPHTATRTLPDGTTETKTFTQEQWRDRNKSEGWTRPEGEGGGETGGGEDAPPSA